MTQLYLIRHGQASFGSDDYDVLSELGHRQAALLGRHLADCRVKFDAVYAGSMQRQQKTAAEMLQALGDDPARIQTDPDFNEYDANAVFQRHLPGIVRKQPELAELAASVGGKRAYANSQLFRQAFRGVLMAWLDDPAEASDDFETALAFERRIQAAVNRIAEAHPGRQRVAVVSSGGVISMCLRWALGLAHEPTVEMNWTICNSSVTRLALKSGSPPRLFYMNNLAHLDRAADPDLITFV